MKLYPTLVDRLRTQHTIIEQLIRGVEKTRLPLHPEGKWSLIEHIVHLATYQPIFIDRIQTILSKDEPSFDRYNADNDPNFLRCRGLGLEVILSNMNVDRSDLYKLITSLTPEQLSRVGVHKKFGRLTVVQWVEFFLLHEAHHMLTIFQLAHDVDLVPATAE